MATIWIKKSDWLKIRSGRGILIYSAGQGLRGQDIFKKFSAILFKGDNLCDHVCLPAIKPLLEKGPILKAKNLLFREDLFSEGDKIS